MTLDDSSVPEFLSWRSYQLFANRVRSSNRFVWGIEVQAFLDTVVATINDRDEELDVGTVLFRSQRGIKVEEHFDSDGVFIRECTYGYDASRMKPLADRAKEGRANPAGIPVLYLGTTVETVISEARPWVGTEVSVARCKVLKKLRTLDLSLGHGRSSFAGPMFGHVMNGTEPPAVEKRTAVWIDIDNAFSKPVTVTDDAADYAPTQILAELFRSLGYDAIAYKSQFGDEDGYNIAVFDLSAVEITSCAPYRVESIKVVAHQFDNEWFSTPKN